jgi:hypothetical protein
MNCGWSESVSAKKIARVGLDLPAVKELQRRSFEDHLRAKGQFWNDTSRAKSASQVFRNSFCPRLDVQLLINVPEMSADGVDTDA